MSDETHTRSHEQLVAGFNLYRTPGVAEALDEVRVATCYEGIVVESAARVIEVCGHQVTLAVTDEEVKALSRTHLAFVESPVHGTSFRASVEHLEFARGEVCLSKFEPLKAYIGRREEVRVAPVHTMLVRLNRGAVEMHGRVVDISTKALAADVNNISPLRLDSSKGELALNVWGESQADEHLPDFEVMGTVFRVEDISDAGANFSRLIIAYEPYPALEQQLNRYIARRHREILVTLENEQSPESVPPA